MNACIRKSQYGLLCAIIILFGTLGCQKTSSRKEPVRRIGSVPGEFVAQLSYQDPRPSQATALQEVLGPALLQMETLFSHEGDTMTPKQNMLWLKLDCAKMSCQVKQVRELLQGRLKDFGVKLTELNRNYLYEGDALESTQSEPSDPRFSEQLHHSLIESLSAWELSTGSPEVIVAVTDNGFDYEHEDLRGSFWQNKGETGLDRNGQDRASNGIDDDDNGYIDDALGWDFTKGGDNDPAPESLFSGVIDGHGTHIAGIIAAVKDNETGVAGVAPGVKVMPLRFSGSGTWSSITVARSYAYAVKHGAKIINTSYSIDAYIDDPVYRMTLAQAYERGVLIFNSAGNNGKANPARQGFEELLLVANTYSQTTRLDQKNPNSNYGYGIDIAAPGDILSTVPGDDYRIKTGTSMSAPIAAAVAALIWSVHPDWSRNQVAAQLLATSDPIDAMNPDFRQQLGDGRINARRALLEPNPGVELQILQGRLQQGLDPLTLRNRGRLDPDSITTGSIQLHGPLEPNATEAEQAKLWPLSPQGSYKIGSNQIRFELPTELPLGRYVVRLNGLVDPFGKMAKLLIGAGESAATIELVARDEVAPVLERLEAPASVSLQESSFTVDLLCRDNRTGIISATLQLRHQFNNNVIVAKAELDEAQQALELRFNLNERTKSGRYQFEELSLVDWEGNLRLYKSKQASLPPDLSNLSIHLKHSDGLDDLGPQLLSVGAPDLVRIGAPFTLQLEAEDEGSALAKLYYEWRGATSYLSVRGEVDLAALTTDEDGRSYEIALNSPEVDEPDRFYLASLTLVDNPGNRSTYRSGPESGYFYNSQIAAPSFYAVRNLDDDWQAPQVLDLHLEQEHILLGDNASLIATIVDDAHPIVDAKAYFRREPLSIIVTNSFQPLPNQQYRLGFQSQDYHELGEYVLYKFEAKDELGNLKRMTLRSNEDLVLSDSEIMAPRFQLQSKETIDFDDPIIGDLALYQDAGARRDSQLWLEMQISDRSAIDYIDVALVSEDLSEAYWSLPAFSHLGQDRYRVQLVGASQLDKLARGYLVHSIVVADVHGNTRLLEADFSRSCFDLCQRAIPRLAVKGGLP